MPAIKTKSFVFVEDYDDKMDAKFTEETACPYFKALFGSLSYRNTSPRKGKSSEKLIDNATFFEYVKLPGIIADRFFSSFERQPNGINEAGFVKGFLRLF